MVSGLRVEDPVPLGVNEKRNVSIKHANETAKSNRPSTSESTRSAEPGSERAGEHPRAHSIALEEHLRTLLNMLVLRSQPKITGQVDGWDSSCVHSGQTRAVVPSRFRNRGRDSVALATAGRGHALM